VHTFYISKTVPAKFRLLGGMMGSIVPSLVLLILSDGGRGVDFWRFMFPAQALGAFFMWYVRASCICAEQTLIRHHFGTQYHLSSLQRPHHPVCTCGVQRSRKFRLSDVRPDG
jgi:hypothetical protein